MSGSIGAAPLYNTGLMTSSGQTTRRPWRSESESVCETTCVS